MLFHRIGEEGQRKLLSSCAVIIGCGALGSVAGMLLARAGVGRLRIVDRDFVELENLQRQVLFDEQDVRESLPKAVAARRRLAAINSDIQIEAEVSDVQFGNVEQLIGDADVVLDGTDNFETRFVINDACVKLFKPWVYAGAVGSHGMVMGIVPGRTACFRCLVGELPAPGSSPTCDTAGIVNAASTAVASLQTAEALKILTGVGPTEGLVTLDVWSGTVERFNLRRLPDCPACGRREFSFLRPVGSGSAVILCGRNAVQVTPPVGRKVDLQAVARRLGGVANEFLLRVTIEGHEVTLFPDGRAIIKGTEDPVRARSIYAKFIGA